MVKSTSTTVHKASQLHDCHVDAWREAAELELESGRAQILARKNEIIEGMWGDHAKITAAVEQAPAGEHRSKMREAMALAKQDPDTDRTLWELACRWFDMERLGTLDYQQVEQHKLRTEIDELWPVRVWEDDTPHVTGLRDTCTLTERAQQRSLAAEHRRLQATAQRVPSTKAETLAGATQPKSPREAAKTRQTLKFEAEVFRAMNEVWNRYPENRAKDPTLTPPKKGEMYGPALDLLNVWGVKGKNKNPTPSMVKDAAADWKRPREPQTRPVPALAPKPRHGFKGEK
jgi:hypothetical protein